MNLEQSFEVKAPVEKVWAALTDVPRVAPCLPGAEIAEGEEEGTYKGNFKVKLGPTTAAYRGTLKMENLDEAGHVATMSAKGQDRRGQGTANATIVSTMREEGGVTKVDVVTDFTITGKLASFGRGGMIKDVSNRLLKEFADCLQASLESDGDGTGASAAADGAEAAAPTNGAGASGSNLPVPTVPDAPPPGSPDTAAAKTPGATGTPPAGADGGGALVPAGAQGGAEAELRAIREELAGVRAALEALVRAQGGSTGSTGSPRPQAKPINGVSLMVSVVTDRVKALVGRGS